ncbi:helix-turn-helix domain-containing protein [uncultured Ramlibacter sp.]|uniref:helix-turn-helix domain-containing protein n=1 Tax=uncultured Ramlibacter sp. TaxID=260755 RepID=UPI00260A0EC8|nr:helix-turn-helix domain-containing protein [uncultured Ramlibacter sp.]
MKTAAAPLLLVPFREVRHWQPDDCLHYEPLTVRGRLHGWTIPAHRHEGLVQFQLLAQGSASATIDGREHALQAPAVLLLAPGSVHGFRYAPDSAGHQVTVPLAVLHAALQGADQLEALLGQSCVLEDAAGCAPLFEALAAEFQQEQPGRAQALQAQATLIVLWFLRHRGAQQAGARHSAVRDTLVQRLRALVETHYREHRPLAFYADALRVTPDHLSRTCRSVTGRSALELVHERLMLEARRLLVYTPMKVADIAASLGYEDPAYFRKFFARAVGKSASAYREAVSQGVLMQDTPAV